MRSPIPGRLRGRRPSPSMAVAMTALVLSMAGTATAAKVLITSGAQVRNGTLTGLDVKDGSLSGKELRASAVTSDKVRNGSIAIDDLEAPARAAIQDAGTQAIEAFRLDGPRSVPAGEAAKVATLAGIPPGTYAIFAKTILTAIETRSGLFQQGNAMGGHCRLDAGEDVDHSRGLLGSPGANSPGEMSMQLTRTFSQAGAAAVTCDVEPASWSASNTSIIAIRLGTAPRQPVDG